MKNGKDNLEEHSAELIEKAQWGDMDALWKLWESCQVKVESALRKRYSYIPSAEIKDLVQSTWLKVSKRIGQFVGKRWSFDSWVITIARNHTIDYLRSISCRIPTTELKEYHDQDMMSVSWIHREIKSPQEIFDSKAVMANIYGEIDKLPEIQRTCILLKIDWNSHEEISEITGISLGKINYHVKRAQNNLEKLKKIVK
jgi:RNA polymerase sigma-70 factor, ECF subfamily